MIALLLKQLCWYREFSVNSLHSVHKLVHCRNTVPIIVEGGRIGVNLQCHLESKLILALASLVKKSERGFTRPSSEV